MNIRSYPRNDNFHLDGEKIRKEYDEINEKWEEEKNKFSYDMDHVSNLPFYKSCSNFFEINRKYLEAENKLSGCYLDGLKFYYEELKSVAKTREEDEEAYKLLHELYEAFDVYFDGCEVLRVNLENYKKAYNEFLGYKLHGKDEVQACADMIVEMNSCEAIQYDTIEKLRIIRNLSFPYMKKAGEVCMDRKAIGMLDYMDKMDEFYSEDGEPKA